MESRRTAGPGHEFEEARAAGRWIVSQVAAGPPDPGPDRSPLPGGSAALYGGASGMLLFLERLAEATGDQWVGEAAAGLRTDIEKAADAVDSAPPGLYSGLSGLAFTLAQRESSRGLADRLIDHVAARPLSPDDCSDIISGLAGSGLTLLWAARELGRSDALEAARATGDHLLERGETCEPAREGRLWRMRPSDAYVMPNFSHGTAGVAFFLARLGARVGEERFLSAAEAGARHLVSIADRIGDGIAVHHHAPGGESLHYLGWCHGPPGTARLFQELAVHTGDPAWADARDALARGLLAAGIPEGRTDGFWRNYGRCCGDAGVAEFAQDLLDAGASLADDLRDLANRCTANVLRHAVASHTPVGEGLSWPHCEHRNRPDDVESALGLMQGAAGIGFWLLRSASAQGGGPPPLRLPDDIELPAVTRSSP